MKHLRTSIKSNKNILYFLVIIFGIGVISGVIFYLKQDQIMKESITASLDLFKENISNINTTNILYHCLIIGIIFLLSILVIGIPITLFYLFYEGMSLGFLVVIFTTNFGLKGFLFALIFYIITKLIYILMIIYLSIISIKIGHRIIKRLFKKSNESLSYSIKRNLLRTGIVLGFTVLNDLIIYFVGLKILNLFIFLL